MNRHRVDRDDETDTADQGRHDASTETADVDGPGPAPEPADEAHQSVALSSVSGLSPRQLRQVAPPVTLYLHLSAEAVSAGSGVARLETVGPVLLRQLRDLLAGTHITVRPIVDPDLTPADGYEIPDRLREHLVLTQPHDIFPYGIAESRHLDIDHTRPYQPPDTGGPPGQTRIDNLGPLVRHHHRIKTHSRWTLRQPSPGTYLWRSPHGWISLVTNQGTLTLGTGDYAQTLWHAAGTDTQADPPDRTQDDYVPTA